jgi:hypothetical protein
MDDHHPAGFRAVKLGAPATIFHHAPSPYGIPYRSLYSRNVPNLMFAGRDASCTHAAMSSTRVMGTGCSMGQAAGTAAAMAVKKGLLPAGIGAHMDELQQALLCDDAYLPGIRQRMPELTMGAELSATSGDPAPVRDGVNRPVGEDPHCWTGRPGEGLVLRFGGRRKVSTVTLIVDSALDSNIQLSYHQRDDQLAAPPPAMPRSFRLEKLLGGKWLPLVEVARNHQRLVRVKPGNGEGVEAEGVRFTLGETWGAEQSRVYAFYVE